MKIHKYKPLIFLIVSSLFFLNSCSIYKEPKSGPVATFLCDQPPKAALIALPSAPVTQILGIDGKVPFSMSVNMERPVKVAAGSHEITISGIAGGGLTSRTVFNMSFTEGETYKVKTLPFLKGCEVRDSRGKLVMSAKPQNINESPPPTLIFLPVR